jgi:hypothetical protein
VVTSSRMLRVSGARSRVGALREVAEVDKVWGDENRDRSLCDGAHLEDQHHIRVESLRLECRHMSTYSRCGGR